MKKTWVVPTLAALIIGGSSFGITAANAQTPNKQVVKTTTNQEANDQNQTEGKDVSEAAQLSKQAKVSVAVAKTTALTKVSGTVKGAELEDENGNAVYNVAILNSSNKTEEVKVDAKTGKVLKVETGGDTEGNSSESASEKKDANKEQAAESAQEKGSKEKDTDKVEQQGQH